MANFYLDISAVGNEYQAYADTPATWGVPQDGNGKAGPGHAAAVGIATIDCASASASGAGQIFVMGQSVSSTLTGSGATLAANIVTAINACATATTATYCQALLPVNRLVYARQNPGQTTQVQIMVRIAGADWASLPPTYAGTWGTAPTITGFAGGAAGPFAYLFSLTASVFGRTVLNYGIGPLKSPGTSEPTLSDYIHVRTARGGADIALNYTISSGTSTFLLCPTGSTRTYIFDDGTVWSGDDGQLIFNYVYNANAGSSSFSANGQTRVLAKKKYGFHVTYTSAYPHVLGVGGGSGVGDFEYDNVWFEELNSGNSSAGCAVNGQTSTTNFYGFTGCKFTQRAGRSQVGPNGSGGMSWYRYLDCEWDYFNLTSAPTGIITNTSSTYPVRAEFINCRFIDRSGVYKLVNPITNLGLNPQHRILIENCSGIDPFGAALATDIGTPSRLIQWTLPGASRQFQTESYMATVGWQEGAGIPTLTERLPDGATPWALRCILRDAAASDRVLIEITRLGMYVRSSGALTLTVQLLIPTGVAFLKSRLGFLLSYIDTTDVVRHETTLLGLHDQTTELDGSSASWDMNGASGLTAKRLSVTTDFSVKTGSVIDAVLVHRGRIPGGANKTIVVNPALDPS